VKMGRKVVAFCGVFHFLSGPPSASASASASVSSKG
jgi:hypothetical protein